MRKNKARSFVGIMIAIALSALIMRFIIVRIIKISIAQNQVNASSTLKLISVALENYAKDNQGAYPKDLSLLVQNNPPYLERDYIKQFPLRGYNYICSRLEPSGYSCSANPAICKITGQVIYTVTTGGVMVSEKCDQKR